MNNGERWEGFYVVITEGRKLKARIIPMYLTKCINGRQQISNDDT